MENDLIGPKTLAYLYDALELNKDMDFTCLMASTVIETKVFEYDHYKTVECDLPDGVRLIQLGVGNNTDGDYEDYMVEVVNFGSMNIKE